MTDVPSPNDLSDTHNAHVSVPSCSHAFTDERSLRAVAEERVSESSDSFESCSSCSGSSGARFSERGSSNMGSLFPPPLLPGGCLTEHEISNVVSEALLAPISCEKLEWRPLASEVTARTPFAPARSAAKRLFPSCMLRVLVARAVLLEGYVCFFVRARLNRSCFFKTACAEKLYGLGYRKLRSVQDV